jgi:sugar transferase (PEP-CTERM/EpsH1 system associated)
MNILFLSTRSPYPLISGHSLRTYHILKGAAENHSVTLVTFVQLREELGHENLDHLRSLCKAVYPFRIPVDISKARLGASLFLNLFSHLPFVAKKYDAPTMRRKIRQIVETESIDLVHVDMLHLAVYIDEFRDLPKVIVNHNVESVRLYRWFKTEPNPFKKTYLGIQWLKLRSFERSVINKFNCSVVVSEIDKQLLRHMGVSTKLLVVPNGTDIDFFKPSSTKPRKNSVLWIGHMDVHTNKDAVLYFCREIYPILRKKHPKVQMTFVGSAPPEEIVEAARKYSQIRITGFVDDIRPYVHQAAVMVVPIRIGSGTRLKILDAMAMGKAIVSTSIGCEGLDVVDGRDILIADEPKDFATKIVDLMNEDEVRTRIEISARKVAERYDWEKIQENQEAVYKYAMERRYT